MTDQEPLTTAELVLLALDQVPRGRVVSYGDLAALVGTGGRAGGVIDQPPAEIAPRHDAIAYLHVIGAKDAGHN